MIKEINKFLQIAIEASLEAGEAVMEIYNSVIEVEYKNDKSPLTLADKLSNEMISRHLSITDYPIISEENKQKDYEERKSWTMCWVVDPVDGTKEFIKRNGEFTINIALVEQGIPKLGVIYVPESKTLYYADVDNKQAFKAMLNNHKHSLETIFALSTPLKPTTTTTKKIRVVGSRSHMNTETVQFIEEIKAKGIEVDVVSKGSSLKFCLVAEGKADVYPRFAPTMEWDTAAGQAICNAVGIEVISKATDKPLLYNKKNLLNPWFLVAKNH